MGGLRRRPVVVLSCRAWRSAYNCDGPRLHPPDPYRGLEPRSSPCAGFSLCRFLELRTSSLLEHSPERLHLLLDHLRAGLTVNEGIGMAQPVPQLVYLPACWRMRAAVEGMSFSRRWQSTPFRHLIYTLRGMPRARRTAGLAKSIFFSSASYALATSNVAAARSSCGGSATRCWCTYRAESGPCGSLLPRRRA